MVNENEQLLKDLIELGSNKLDSGNTWIDITDYLNQEYDVSYSDTYYRKKFKALSNSYVQDTYVPAPINNVTEDIEFRKKRIQLSDIRTAANAQIRRLSREETIKEIAHDYAVQMQSKELNINNNAKYTMYDTPKSAILCLSDWHYGLKCNSIWNTYDEEVAKSRISRVFDKAVKYCKANEVDTLHVVGLGDFICGNIHFQLRYDSWEDVISQTMHVSEILAEELVYLSNNIANVTFRMVSDNHSRISPNLKESLQPETFSRIIDWYLYERLEKVENIKVYPMENNIDQDIVKFVVNGFNVIAVHGDKDTPSNIVKNMATFVSENVDLILTAHYHHLSVNEDNRILVVTNPSLIGTDEYAKSIRKYSYPAQNLIIVGNVSPVECLYHLTV